ncbi:hypothetical protein BOX15_Mlig004604g3, partial [Macrostomum lignano]
RVSGRDTAAAAAVDPYEFLEPTDVLSKLTKGFGDLIVSKKWQERKEALDEVDKLTQVPEGGLIKLAKADYGELFSQLRTVLGKDSNLVLVALSAKCMAQLAAGLRKSFTPYASACLKTALEKFKERKVNVVTPLRELADLAAGCTTLEAMSEDYIAAIGNKAPGVKIETCQLLARQFAAAKPGALNKKLMKPFVAALLKAIDDRDQETRESGYAALGTAMKVIGESNFKPLLGDVDDLKMKKIEECCANAVVVAKPAAASKPTAPAPKAASSAPAPAASLSKTSSAASGTAASRSKTGTSGPRPGAPPPAAKKKTAASTDKGKKGVGGGAGLGDSLPTEQTISDETAVETCSNLFGKEIVEQLESKAWKSRLEAMEAIKTKLNDQIGSEIPCQAAVRVISNAVKPGLKDNNFQVLKLRLETLSYLAANAQFTRTSADACLEEIYDKIGDAKVGDSAKACLTAIAEACSLDYVGVQLAQTVFKLKNPKNQSEALNWLAQSVLEFGLRIPPKELIKYVRQGFAATNPAIRQAAISLTVSLYMYIGDSLRSLLADEKPALLQQIDQEIEQIKDKKPPAPTRGLKHAAAAASGKFAGKAAAGGGANADAGDDDEDDAAGVEDLVPRVDLADKLTDATVAKLGDSNWKIRKEGLDEVRALLNECRLVTSNLGELPERLRQRLADSNKVLCSQAMEISEALAPALGKRHAKNPAVHRPIVSGIVLNGMSDAKPRQRQIACQALNAWCEQVGLALLAEGDLFVEALRKENPFLRAELLGWLAEKLMAHKKPLPADFKECLPTILTCLSDRSGDVRKKATEAIAPIIICIGWDSVMRAWKKLPPASQGDVRAILDKEREKAAAEAPAAPAPAPAPPPPAASSSKPSSATSTSRNASAGAKKSATRASEESSSAGGGGGGSGAASKRKSGSTAALSAAADKKAAAAAAEDAGPIAPIQVNKMREQRLSDEKKRKVLRWDFSGGQPERDHIQQLQRQMTDAGFSSELLGQLFHQDFRQHIKAIESLSAYLDNGGDDAAEGHRCNVDLILKWSAARFYDTNPSMVMRCLEYLNRLFQVMMDREWLLNDSDAQAFFPHLLIKLGEPKDVIRRDVKSLFGKANRVYPASKLFLYFMDGLAAKSAKQRQECLDELGKIIQVQGIGVCQPTPAQAMKAIAKQIGDRDNSVRNAALNTLLVAYRFIGEPLLKMVEPMQEKDRSMLEERIRRQGSSGGALSGSTADIPASSARESTPPKSSGVGSNSATTSRPGTAPSASAAPAQVNSATITRRGGGGGGGGGGSGGGMFQLEAPELDPMPVVPGDSEYDMNAEEEEMNRPVEFPKLARKPAEEDLTLKSSPDAFTAITHVITQVSSTDSKLVCSAVRQLIEVMLDEDRCKLLSGHVDPILLAVTNQISLNTEPADPVGTLDLLRSLLYCLSTVFHVAVLAKCASKDRLKSVFQSAISLVISDSLTRLDPSDADHVNRTVNQLCASVIANADRTRVLLSLLRSLYECVDRVGFSQLFTELNIKCLWRITRELDKHVAEYDWDSVLAECNAFLTSFPLESWQQPDGDAPLRAVTNLLHKLCQLKGRDVTHHLTQIPNCQDSQVAAYLARCLRSLPHQPQQPHQQPQQQRQQQSQPAPQLGRSAKHEKLVEIFKKIGSKENTREGLNELYDFKQANPDTDLKPYLSKASAFFNRYIEQGLRSIEKERLRAAEQQQQQQQAVSALMSTGGQLPKGSGGQLASEMLAKLREFERTHLLNHSQPDQLTVGAAGARLPTAQEMLDSLKKFQSSYLTQADQLSSQQSGQQQQQQQQLQSQQSTNSDDNQQHQQQQPTVSSRHLSAPSPDASSAAAGRQQSGGQVSAQDLMDLKARLDRVKRGSQHSVRK